MIEGQELRNKLLIGERTQRIEHRKQDEHGDNHRQAAAHRGDAFLAIELLKLLVELFLIVLILLLKGLHLRLNELHALGGLAALEVERHDNQLDQDGEDDDGHSVVVDEGLQRLNQRQQQ